MRYETKIYSTRFNVIAENNIFYGKIIFKITEKEAADFYFNKGELSSKMFIFLSLLEHLVYLKSIVEFILQIV